MSLLITILNAPESVAVSESSKSFDEEGGTVGRGKNNTWVLEDPERFLSSRHCQISCENGQFYITDLSTNGTFYNNSSSPLGKGTKLPVNDGDTFILGDYEMSVSVSNALSKTDPFGSELAESSFMADDPFAFTPAINNGASQNGLAANPFASGHVSSVDSVFSSSPEETDPLALLDKVQDSVDYTNPTFGVSGEFKNSADPFNLPTHSDQANPLNEQVVWPESVAEPPSQLAGTEIPEDWYEDSATSELPAQPSMPLTEPPVMPDVMQNENHIINDPAVFNDGGRINNPEDVVSVKKYQALKKTLEKIQTEHEILKQKMSARQRITKNDVTVDTSLVNALGLQGRDLVDAEIKQINELAGELVREMVSGLMQVLGSRSSIKNEFRMNVTTIRPVENNPLKFSATINDALENMFIRKGSAYKSPIDSVREGFDDISEHQIAVLAGIRSAFKRGIDRFDPVMLEKKFSRQNKGSLIPAIQKARYWDLYLEYYNDLVGDIDDTFQYLFGDNFVQAYEDQLKRLAVARKSKINQ